MDNLTSRISVLAAFREAFGLLGKAYGAILRRFLIVLPLLIFESASYAGNGSFFKTMISLLVSAGIVILFFLPAQIIGIQLAMQGSVAREDIKSAIHAAKLDFYILSFLMAASGFWYSKLIAMLPDGIVGLLLYLVLTIALSWLILIPIQLFAIPLLVIKKQWMAAALKNAYQTLRYYWVPIFWAVLIMTVFLLSLIAGSVYLVVFYLPHLTLLMPEELALLVYLLGYLLLFVLFCLLIIPFPFIFYGIIYRQISQDAWFIAHCNNTCP